MKVYLAGACDRNNFGDLLMPVVFEKQFKNKYKLNVTFDTYSMIKSDLSSIKANKTNALFELYNKGVFLIFVGGEVLSADYTLMYYNLQKKGLKLFFIRVIHKFFPRVIEILSRKILGGKSYSPWVLNKKDFGCRKIIYNTVGGDVKNESFNDLKTADYISVRNKKDYNKIKKINSNVNLCPDSITAISNIIPSDLINNNVQKDIKDMCNDSYFIVQVDERNSRDLIRIIAEQINTICEKCNINCILLPIGYAQGHEDQIALAKIYKNCNYERVKFTRKTNIYETLYILKNSTFFIGTSLHGIIISTSYCVPHMILTDRINKLIDYMKTWKTSPILYSDADQIFNNFCKLYNNVDYKRKLKIKSKELIQLVDNNFDRINDMIVKEYENE